MGLSCDYLRSLFIFRDGNLYWKERPSSHFSNQATCNSWNGKNAGSMISSVDAYGYLRVRIDGERYKAHRVIWQMFNGPIQEGAVIDHINHIKSDNRLENLRVVSVGDNNRNSPLRNDNSSGVTGVYWNSRAKKYQATICLNGKRKSLGYFASIDQAKVAKNLAEATYGYHQNHGIKEVA